MGNAVNDGIKINVRSVIIVSALSLAYLLLSWFLVGFKSDQLWLTGIFNFLFYLSPVTRKFILGFSIFIVYWIIFDYMKAFPNYHYNTVHIADLYNFEKKLFGINFKGKLVTPNEYWRLNGSTFLDVAAVFFIFAGYRYPSHLRAFYFLKTGNNFFIFR